MKPDVRVRVSIITPIEEAMNDGKIIEVLTKDGMLMELTLGGVDLVYYPDNAMISIERIGAHSEFTRIKSEGREKKNGLIIFDGLKNYVKKQGA